MRPSPWFASLILVVASAAPAVAQRLSEPWVPGAVLRQTRPSPSRSKQSTYPHPETPAGRAVGAIIGGTTGLFAGAYLGSALDIRAGSNDDLGLGGVLIGAVLGESLGMVAGADLAGPSQSKAIDWLAVPAIAVAGVALAAAVGRGEILIVIPFAQMYELMSGRPDALSNTESDGAPVF